MSIYAFYNTAQFQHDRCLWMDGYNNFLPIGESRNLTIKNIQFVCYNAIEIHVKFILAKKTSADWINRYSGLPKALIINFGN